MMLRYLLTERKAPETTASIFLYVVGRIASVIGIATAFWHVSWIAGTLLLGSGAIGFGIYYSYIPNPSSVVCMSSDKSKRAVID